jgi:nitrite reductase/ring-hydroxylating ferredoxin subunit
MNQSISDKWNKMNSGWIPVSGITDVPASAARAVVLPAHDIAIWRTGSGAVRAWENRCPHRGMRMSFGQVRGEHLVCRYHGWGFDETGQCQTIPASPGMAAPPTACVKSWGCYEDIGLIWVNTAETPEEFIPVNASSSQIFCKTIHVDGSADELVAKIRMARFIPFGHKASGLEGVTWSSASITDCLIELTASDDSGKVDVIMVAVHQGNNNRCGLHVTTASRDDAQQDNEVRLFHSQWAKRLRWALANPDADGDGFAVFA